MTGRFTGWHMTFILVGFFSVVIAVNLVMAHFATSTFGGLVVENSYVASQKYDSWLEAARREKALGWTFEVKRGGAGHLTARLAGKDQPIAAAVVVAVARHPLGRLPERKLHFRPDGNGAYTSVDALPSGRWIVHLKASAGGHSLNKVVDLT